MSLHEKARDTPQWLPSLADVGDAYPVTERAVPVASGCPLAADRDRGVL